MALSINSDHLACQPSSPWLSFAFVLLHVSMIDSVTNWKAQDMCSRFIFPPSPMAMIDAIRSTSS